jgi:hypothetical protein
MAVSCGNNIHDLPAGTDKLPSRDSDSGKTKYTAEMPISTTHLSIYSNLQEFSTGVEDLLKGKLGLHMIRKMIFAILNTLLTSV